MSTEGSGDLEENRQLQEDEFCALESIYADDGVLTVSGVGSYSFHVPGPGSPNLVLAVHLPETYPSAHPPLFELRSDFLPADVVEELACELEVAFSPGEVVLFNWIEHLKERWQELAPQSSQQQEPQATAAVGGYGVDEAAQLLEQVTLAGQLEQPSEEDLARASLAEARMAAMAEVADTIIHGEPFTEKRSTFQAHLAPVHNVQQVEAVIEMLLQNNKIRAATHNISAYRIERPDKCTFQQDCDDDGETAAGGRLLHLLQMVDARNVVVVVSRWYGGILLGPARFTHINNAARELLDACGYIEGRGEGGGKGKGKSKGGGKR